MKTAGEKFKTSLAVVGNGKARRREQRFGTGAKLTASRARIFALGLQHNRQL